ncbi:hypothetical protein [Shinella sp. BYT-45]
MLDTVTAIFMEVVRLLTFQARPSGPQRHRKAVVNHSDTDRVR